MLLSSSPRHRSRRRCCCCCARCSVVLCEAYQGRLNQIRLHLAHNHTPIANDLSYVLATRVTPHTRQHHQFTHRHTMNHVVVDNQSDGHSHVLDHRHNDVTEGVI